MKSTNDTFHKNAAYLVRLSSPSTVRFILRQLFDDVVRLDEHHPIGIYILPSKNKDDISFVRARSVSRSVVLHGDTDYFVVPACYNSNSLGKFHLDITCDVPFALDKTERRPPETPIVVAAASARARSTSTVRTKPKIGSTATRTTGATRANRDGVSLITARMHSMANEYDLYK
jgi:hypothetical protein